MDTVNISSSLLQNAIAGLLEKLIRQKAGVHPQLRFNDPIQISYDGDRARVHLNIDADLEKNDLEALLRKLR